MHLSTSCYFQRKDIDRTGVEKGLIRTLSNGDAMARLATELQPVFRFARTVGQPQQVLEMAPKDIR